MAAVPVPDVVTRFCDKVYLGFWKTLNSDMVPWILSTISTENPKRENLFSGGFRNGSMFTMPCWQHRDSSSEGHLYARHCGHARSYNDPQLCAFPRWETYLSRMNRMIVATRFILIPCMLDGRRSRAINPGKFSGRCRGTTLSAFPRFF